MQSLGGNLDLVTPLFHVEEMADPRLRGALSACVLLTYSIGIMVISLLGTHISWRIVAGLAAVITFIDLVGYSLLRESPVWLVRNNRVDQASEVYNWLWGPGHQPQVTCVTLVNPTLKSEPALTEAGPILEHLALRSRAYRKRHCSWRKASDSNSSYCRSRIDGNSEGGSLLAFESRQIARARQRTTLPHRTSRASAIRIAQERI
ncbi:hypothetical protein ANN_08411 [Periplaneta americana]|uniref:Major facilitator superfamily (MFS) profile domain-containing protein n=1 Tax=Periplaneta americana TaxID=6978 RepID=A0ABQ8T2V2_PERAM|nr:hypothetical protein ANN_08411 [Periplaneta americana]